MLNIQLRQPITEWSYSNPLPGALHNVIIPARPGYRAEIWYIRYVTGDDAPDLIINIGDDGFCLNVGSVNTHTEYIVEPGIPFQTPELTEPLTWTDGNNPPHIGVMISGCYVLLDGLVPAG